MWALVLLLVVGVAGIVALVRWENRMAKTWEVVAEGELDRIEHRQHRYSTRSGAMVHTTTHHVVTISTVIFADGSRVVCWGRMDPHWPKGTRVRMLRNGLGRHRMEQLERAV